MNCIQIQKSVDEHNEANQIVKSGSETDSEFQLDLASEGVDDGIKIEETKLKMLKKTKPKSELETDEAVSKFNDDDEHDIIPGSSKESRKRKANDNGKKGYGWKKQNNRNITRNQAAKNQKLHKCQRCQL